MPVNIQGKPRQVGSVRIKNKTYPLFEDRDGRVFYEVVNTKSGQVERQLWIKVIDDVQANSEALIDRIHRV